MNAAMGDSRTATVVRPPVRASDDDRILELIRAGAPEGMEMLYDRYGTLAYTLAVRIVADQGAAEDVVQEAFLSVWRRSSTYEPGRGSLRTWVCSIVQHRALDRLRGKSGRARMDLHLETAAGDHADLSDTWQQVILSLERDEIARALAGLPAEQRNVIDLAYFAGYTQVEISDVLAIPLGTVKGRIRLALIKLREALGAHERVRE